MGGSSSKSDEPAPTTTPTTTTTTTATTTTTYTSTTEHSTIYEASDTLDRKEDVYLITLLPILSLALILVFILTMVLWTKKFRRSKHKSDSENNSQVNDRSKTSLQYAELDFIKNPNQDDLRNNNKRETSCSAVEVADELSEVEGLQYVELAWKTDLGHNDIYVNN